MRDEDYNGFRRNFIANMNRHANNVRIMLENTGPIHDRWLVSSVETELTKIAEYQGKMAAIDYVLGVDKENV